MLNFEKAGGLVSAIAQDAATGEGTDDRLDEPGGVRRDGPHRPRRVLQPQPQPPVAQGRGRAATCKRCRAFTSIATPTRVLLKVTQVGGAACHEGYKSCFFRELVGGELTPVGVRVFDPKAVYRPKS